MVLHRARKMYLHKCDTALAYETFVYAYRCPRSAGSCTVQCAQLNTVGEKAILWLPRCILARWCCDAVERTGRLARCYCLA